VSGRSCVSGVSNGFPLLFLEKRMNSVLELRRLAIFNFPPKLLTFSNWVLNQGKSFFPLDQIAIGPLDYSVISKTILGF
jgi:hypothetical protein